jgi:hypothetical protein
LKLIGKTEEELKNQVQTFKNFSDDIHIEFRLVNCVKIVFNRGKLVYLQNLILYINREIQQLELGKTYKCLGKEKGEGVQH